MADEANDESDADEIIEGDFVVVRVDGKQTAKLFIARVDIIDEYEGAHVYLKR